MTRAMTRAMTSASGFGHCRAAERDNGLSSQIAIEPRPRPSYKSGMAKPSDHWEEIKARYLSGEELSAIAEDLKLSVETVQTKASRTGLTKLRKQMQTVCKEKKIESLESLSALVRSKLAADAIKTIERVDNYDLDGIKDESTREQILGSVAKRSALVFGWSDQSEAASISINLLGSMPDRLDSITLSNKTIEVDTIK